jgi:hypothetical protein
MKKAIFAILGLFLLVTSCKKSSDDGSGSGTTPTPYMSITANSTWQYEQITNPSSATPVSVTYTLTSTTKDSSIGGKQYHVFTNSSTNGSEYYNITGSDYYQYRDLPAALGNAKIDALYLKDNLALNSTWSQAVTVTVSGVPVALNVTYTIIEKGGSKTVNGNAYTDVITVKTDITPTTPGIPASALTTDIKSYYARKVGLIQSDNKVVVNFAGFNQTSDTQLKLKSSDIK